jgi:hypothetical protein
MKPPLEALLHRAEAVDLHPDSIAVVAKTDGSPLKQSRSEGRWFRPAAQTFDWRHGNLERAHWKKVWRSLQDD